MNLGEYTDVYGQQLGEAEVLYIDVPRQIRSKREAR